MTGAAPAGAVALSRDTAVVPLGPGRFAATVSPHWFVPRGPSGGYVAALVLRALTRVVDDPARAPRSLTLHFLRAPAPGPCEVVVVVERAGRSVTSLSARLLQQGETMVVALAAFAVEFESALDFAAPAPDVGFPPAELEPLSIEGDSSSVADRFVAAPAFGPPMLSGGSEAVTGGWLRLAEPEEPDAATIAFFVDAWLPAPMARMTTAPAAPTVDLTIHFRAPLPHPGLTAHTPVLGRFSSTTSAGGFFEEDGELWAPDGTLLAQCRQLALLYPAR